MRDREGGQRRCGGTEECNRKRDREPNGAYFLDGGAPIYSTLSWYSFLTETGNQSNI